jgi:hypothetical protein
MIRKLTTGTILSTLVFLSVSFLTVLLQINSPLHRQTNSEFNIGFPLTYYSQFMADDSIPNAGWNGNSLLLDILITWTITTGTYILITNKTKK